jgi:hypothetical protein
VSPTDNRLRSVVDQTEWERGGPSSILSRQSRDHHDLNELMHAYDRTADVAERGRILAELSERSLRHAFAEETVLFPAYRKHLPDEGDALTAHIEGEHQEINDLLERFQDADLSDPENDRLVHRMFSLISSDARNEEDVLLPRLQQVASVQELRAIGNAWEVSRTTSPTRPHPRISRRPPGNLLAGVPLAAWDRTMDAVDKLGPVRRSGVSAGKVAGQAVRKGAVAGLAVGAGVAGAVLRRRSGRGGGTTT